MREEAWANELEEEARKKELGNGDVTREEGEEAGALGGRAGNPRI